MKKVEVIMLTTIEGIGDKYSLVKVKSGYARNYLVPNNLAVIATPSLKKHYEEIRKQRLKKEEKIIEEYKKMAQKLEGVIVRIPAKASPNGKIFGSVSNIQIAEFLNSMGYPIVRQNIKIIGQDVIKEIGDYQAEVKIYKDITTNIKIQVYSD